MGEPTRGFGRFEIKEAVKTKSKMGRRKIKKKSLPLTTQKSQKKVEDVWGGGEWKKSKHPFEKRSRDHKLGGDVLAHGADKTKRGGAPQISRTGGGINLLRRLGGEESKKKKKTDSYNWVIVVNRKTG